MNEKGSAIRWLPGSARAGKGAVNNTVRIALFAVAAFTAVTAVGGGLALMTGLEGDRFPLELLQRTPFSSYVIPGLILTVAVGGSATVAAAALLRNPGIGALASMVAGMVLMGWIIGEVLILNQPAARSWAEAVYFAVGLTMAGLGLVAGRFQRNQQIH